jgi:hypothetical protein
MVGTSLAASSAVSGPITGDGRPVTLYLHSTSPYGTLDEALQSQNAAGGPTMDETAPTGVVPKTTSNTLGAPNYRKNQLLSWWGAEVHGRISNAKVDLWIAARTATEVTVTLFGDGGTGPSVPVSRAKKKIEAQGLSSFQLVLPGVVDIDREMVLSIDSTTPASVVYDAVDTPSSLSFDLGTYVTPPPIGSLFTPASGWGSVAPVGVEKAARESSLAVNPANENEMLMCDPSGVPATGEGHSYFYVSRDGGKTWSELEVEPDGDPRANAFEGGDCDVAYDDAGTMYTADTWLGNLSVGASRDGGATWTGTPIAVTIPVVDRPWLVGGPDGTVYLTYQDLQTAMASTIWFTRSSDHGASFAPVSSITTSSVDGAFTWTGNFVVSGGGRDLYSVYTRRGQQDTEGPETVWVAASHDGGTTWAQNKITSTPNRASYLYASIGLDSGGGLHVVYASATDDDQPVWYSYSTDRAVHWSEPIKLTSGTGGTAPWVAGAGPGQAAVIWYGTPKPMPSATADQDWFLYWARVGAANTGTPTVTWGTTTTNPLFHGKQNAIPEFNQVRLDSAGRMRIGASVYRGNEYGAGWVAYYQQQL